MDIKISTVLSFGAVMGKVKKNHVLTDYSSSDSKSEIDKFENTIAKSHEDIKKLKEKHKEMEDYLIALELMILDKSLKSDVVNLINNGYSAYNAIKEVMDNHVELLSKSTSTYLKERTNDFLDVKNRLLSNLRDDVKENSSEKYILCDDEIFPTDLIADKDNIIGIIAKKGGYTSHVSIMCRNWDIPYILCDYDFKDGDILIIDTFTKYITINPTIAEANKFLKEINKSDAFVKKAVKHDDYLFLANISSNAEINKVIDYGFDGVGLYRTEIIFMNTDRPYTFLEQYEIYKEAVLKLKGKAICFRTFDIGDDKQLPYLKAFKKGIDNYKMNPILFETQIEALLKVSLLGDVRIMFPMIETKEEFDFLRDWVKNLAILNDIKIPKIGMMLETKEALNHIYDFFDVDFISIGTNDLTHELYKVNRLEALDETSKYMDDMIQKIKAVVDFANKNNVSLSICGELASTFESALLFYKAGVKNLSVSPQGIRVLNAAYTEFKQN